MRAGDDTLRVRLAASGVTERRGRAALSGVVSGYLSPRGLPPMAGSLLVTDTGLVFRSADGRYDATLPVVGPVRRSTQGRWRASAVTLAYVDDALGRRSYLFRVDGGVFETDAPGALLDVAEHPRWLDSLGSREWMAERALVDPDDDVAVARLLDAIMAGPYADSLYAIFGRPTRPAGIVGARGRAAGRLGEYVGTRDSLALDPGRMTSVRPAPSHAGPRAGAPLAGARRRRRSRSCGRTSRRSAIPSATATATGRSTRRRRRPLPSTSCSPP